MLKFGKKKDRTKEMEVQRLLTKIINTRSHALDGLHEGPRGEVRADLTLVVIVVPQSNDRPDHKQAFATVTKEVSSTGMSLVLSEQLHVDQLFLAMELEGEMKYVRAEVRHQDPMGGGLVQAGVCLTEIVAVGDYPEMSNLRI